MGREEIEMWNPFKKKPKPSNDAEKAACLAGRKEEVKRALKAKGIFPYTDLTRKSTM